MFIRGGIALRLRNEGAPIGISSSREHIDGVFILRFRPGSAELELGIWLEFDLFEWFWLLNRLNSGLLFPQTGRNRSAFSSSLISDIVHSSLWRVALSIFLRTDLSRILLDRLFDRAANISFSRKRRLSCFLERQMMWTFQRNFLFQTRLSRFWIFPSRFQRRFLRLFRNSTSVSLNHFFLHNSIVKRVIFEWDLLVFSNLDQISVRNLFSFMKIASFFQILA